MPYLIELKNVVRSYRTGTEEFQALKGINFAIDKGELVAIIGESGAGKSTLVNIIGLLDSPTSGEYFISGEEVSKYNDIKRSETRGHKIGFVFQSFFLLPRLTAAQNVALPLLYRNMPFKKAHARAVAMMERVGIAQLANKKPNQMSGGQQQRVAIARALIGDPELILADEPTGALDSKTSDDVMNLFIELNKTEGKTILMITHNPKVAHACNRFVRIEDGQIFKGPDREL